MYLFLAAVLGLTTSQILCTKPEFMRKTLLSPESSFYGVIAFWWFMVVLSLYATSNQVAVMYFSIFILASNVIAVTLYNAMPTQSLLRMPLVFLAQILVPFIILIDQNYLLMDTMRHATVDGTPEAAGESSSQLCIHGCAIIDCDLYSICIDVIAYCSDGDSTSALDSYCWS